MKRLNTKTQYYLGAGIILFICCVGASWYQYKSLQNQALTEVYRKANIFLSTASAIRSYVKVTLRPRVGRDLTPDQFILEGMSTSYVSRHIMNNLKKNYPDFIYKRAAHNPRNNINGADDFEIEMLSWFSKYPLERQWEGMIKKGNSTYYTRMTPIWAEKECLVCHGVPEDAPKDLLDLYGDKQSFGFSVGDIVGADTIYIPMDKTNLMIKEKTAWVFLFGFVSLFSLFALFALLFNRTVVQQLKQLLLNLKSIYTNDPATPAEIESIPDDEFFQLRHAFRNVTSTLKSVHDELKESETKYRTLFQTSPYTIFVCDDQGQLTDLNQAGISLFALETSGKPISDLNFLDFFFDPDEGKELFKRVEREGAVSNAEHTLVNRIGTPITCLIAAKCLLNENGEIVGMEGVLTDITEDKKMSRLMAQTERMASIGQLAAGVAHEINNPLGVILVYGDLILKSGESSEQIREDTQIIQKHANGCKTIVESLLNFARVSETQMKKADIHRSLMEVQTVLLNQMKNQGIKVTLNLDSEIDEIVCDEDKMKQVFLNLMINSMQAMPDGGLLNLTTRMDREKEVIEIAISDTGSGIESINIERIFEPFYTTKDRGEGTGLGLSVSYGIIKQHNGNINVSSSPGSRTIFSILLPLEAEPSLN